MKASQIISNENFYDITGYGLDADNDVKRTVIIGVKYLEENPGMQPLTQEKNEHPGIRVYPPVYEYNKDAKILYDYMSGKSTGFGLSGAMFSQAFSIVMFWSNHGTEKFLGKLRANVKPAPQEAK